MSARTRFRAVLDEPGVTIAPGVYDGLSARIVESMGFETGSITGAGVSNSRIGLPDMGFMNLSDNAEACRTITRAVDIPVQADADTGYGNAVNVYETIKRLEQTGVAAVMIEDQKWPKRCGHMEGKDTISMEEMCGKVEAAARARDETDPELVIKARTDAAKTHGIDEVVRRLNAYADLGADVLYADALLSKDDIERVAGNVDGHFTVNMGFGIRERPTTPLMSPKELEEAGVAMISYPRLITASAVRGMRDALSTLQESAERGEVVERPEQVLSWEEFMDLMDQPTYQDLEDEFAALEAGVEEPER